MKKKPKKIKPAGFCYIDHSKSFDHPYYMDHMNAHLESDSCKKKK
jgi:hypothetical protein